MTLRHLQRVLDRLVRDQSGAVAVTSALMMLSLLGFMGLAIDVGANYMLRRQAQAAADSASYTAAVAQGAGVNDLSGQALAVMNQYGLSNGKDGVVVTLNTPPKSGLHAGETGAVEVIVERPAAFYFASLLQPKAGVIRARSVATAAQSGGCLYVLNPTAPNALLMNGGAKIQLTGCSVYDNSTSSTALLVNDAILTAQSILVAGGDLLNSPKITGALQTHAGGTADPHASLTLASLGVPSGGNCDSTSLVTKDTAFTATSPHVFCAGLTLQTPKVTFGPGLYVFPGTLLINSSTTVTGKDVTFVFKGNGSILVNGSATLKLSAPTTGPASGLLMVKDPAAPAGAMNIFNGGDTLSLNGALYFPHQSMTLNGPLDMGGCASLLVDTLIVNGGASFVSSCEAGGAGAAKVVE